MHFLNSRLITQINACSRRGSYRELLHLFNQMQREGNGRYRYRYRYALPSTLRACANLADLKTGGELHGLVIRLSFDSDVFIGSALIDMYSKCGRVESARRVFDVSADKDVVVWNSMVSGYVCRGLTRDSMDLFMEMRSTGPRPDLLTWNALISGFSQAGNDAMALRLFGWMRADGIEPDVVSWTSIITGFVQNFRNTEAFEMFGKMVSVGGVLPSSVTISSLLPACASVADSRRGKELHCYALVIGVEGDLFVSSALLDMYAKCGFLFEAENIFCKMFTKSRVSWNSMIFGYANHGYCDDAIKQFYRMQKEGVKPDHLTFTAVFTACSHAGMIELGMTLFHSMSRDYQIEPRLEHYACMVDLLGRAEKLDEAYDFIKEMPLEPDLFVWGSFLGACRIHGNVDLAEIAASHLFELESDQLGSCLLLSNVFADAGRWGDAARIKKVLKKHMLKRSRGCSWIDAA